jgi:lipoprotein signal peptidase
VTTRGLGALVALGVLIADQTAKIALLSYAATGRQGSLALTPILDLVLRWNRGISFSFFAEDSPVGVAILILLTLAATALFAWLLLRSRSTLAAIGLGAIIGGGLGNAFDRIVYGAVVDYLDFHAFGRHFFVFNLADAAINIGVAVLLVDFAFGSRVMDSGNQTASPPGAN